MPIDVPAIARELAAAYAARRSDLLPPSTRDSSFDLMFATAVAASLLSGSHMFMHDFSPLILAMLLSSARMSHYSNSRNASWARFAIRFALSIFWIPPIYFLFVKWHCLYLMAPVLFLFVCGVITLAKRAQSTVKQLVVATG